MTDDSRLPRTDGLPAPEIQRRGWTPRLIWVVPIVAAIVGLFLIFAAWRSAGPRITITFKSADGIEIGKTLVKQRDVTIGTVSQTIVSDDQKTVLITVDLSREGARVAKADSAFWVVRPRIGIAGASGLDTLLTGAFISVNVGTSTAETTHFVGLEDPPPLQHGENGRKIELHAMRVGSVVIGAPVYFRQFPVGHVIDLDLQSDGSTRIDLFIDSPNDRFINNRTRFWNASGIEVKVGTDGVKVKTESLASVISGGIAFDDGPDRTNGDMHDLFRDESQAMAPPNGDPDFLVLRFAHPVRGLGVDSPVEFMGVNIGSVASIDVGFEPKEHSFPLIVTAKIFPQRMGRAYALLAEQGATQTEDRVAEFVEQLVAKGLRAQPRSSGLLSSTLYVALDFFPVKSKVAFDKEARPLEVPTLQASSNEIESRVTSIATKLDEIPLHDIAANLNTDLKDIHKTLEQVSTGLLPTASTTLQSLNGTLGTVNQSLADDSPLLDRINNTLDEAQRTLSSIRELADTLDRHPESLLRGRKHAPQRGENAAAQGHSPP